jgi:CheY-like chemotaxis protein
MNIKETRHQARSNLARGICSLRPLLLAAALCFIPAAHGAEQAEQDAFEGKPLVHRGVGAADFQRELDIHIQKTDPPKIEAEPSSIGALNLFGCAALIPGVIFLWRRWGAFRAHFAPLEPACAEGLPLPADDKLFSDFVTAFESGASAPVSNSSTSVSEATSHTGSTGAGSNGPWVSAPAASKSIDIRRFFELAPERLEPIRTRLSEVSRTSDPGMQQKNFGQLCELVRSFVLICEPPELRPAQQLARGLEGLLRQMSEKASNITPSTLRTAASALVALEAISKPGVRFELASAPPPRFLAVDDDPISRHAVAASLKKVLGPPELAENGESALKLATENLYDVVFLDIEMPGMDGYEVCSRIHEIELNKGTPVVFVTSHSDFDSRAKSAEAGGHDLIGKPFLAFEITVKALTLLLRNRLCKAQATPSKPVLTKTPTAAADAKAQPSPESLRVNQQPSRPDAQPPTPPAPSPNSCAAASLTEEDFANGFFADAPEQIKLVRGHLCAVQESADDAQRQEKIGEAYVATHTLLREAENGQLMAASRLTSAMLGLFKKFLEKPQSITVSAIDTASVALDFLEEFCGPDLKQDLASPPVRILVVDDDAITRRALSGAVQVAFEKPEVAHDGEGAVFLAQQKPFDMIFMDVRMPGIDGFAACAKIHETVLNRQTPVVFVTSHSDYHSRERAAEAGGCGFIPKPALRVEVTLAALTFAFRGRLEKKKPDPISPEKPVNESEGPGGNLEHATEEAARSAA